MVVYVFLQDDRRREKDPDGDAFQFYQRPKAPSIEHLTNVMMSIFFESGRSITDR